MRVLQSAINAGAVCKSDDPGRTIRALAGVAPPNVLVDDQGFSTRIKPVEEPDISVYSGMMFFAKDAETLVRGFRRVGKERNSSDFTLSGSSDLCLFGLTWSDHMRQGSKLGIGLSTVGHNIGAFFLRGAAKHTSIGKTRRGESHGGIFGDGPMNSVNTKSRELPGQTTSYLYESLSKNLSSVSRDNFVYHGAAVFICPNVSMPPNAPGGRQFRNQSEKITMSDLATLVSRLL